MNQTEDHFRNFRIQIFQKLANIAATLGTSARLRIIQLLAQSPRGVEELSQLIGESVANTSQHLQRLAHQELVVSDKRGTHKFYRLRTPLVLNLWECLQDLGQELSPVLRIAEKELIESSFIAPNLPEEIIEKVRNKEAILLDVREEKESVASPIAYAIAIPLDELRVKLRKIQKRKPVFVICRGRFCQLASEAVRMLREQGYDSYRLRESPYRLTKIQAEIKSKGEWK